MQSIKTTTTTKTGLIDLKINQQKTNEWTSFSGCFTTRWTFVLGWRDKIHMNDLDNNKIRKITHNYHEFDKFTHRW